MKRYPNLFSPRHRVKTASLIVICFLAVAIPVAAFLAQRSVELQHKTVSVSTTSSQMISVYSHVDMVETPLARPTQKPTANPVTKTRPTATATTNNTGNFTGTTDEILQWTACKWGIDPNIVRAEAVTESYWHQSQLGDLTTDQSVCPPGTWNGTNCYQSYSILQIKYIYNKGEWPMSRDDTAFSAEYMYGVIRACYEGWTSYLVGRPPSPGYPSYHAGDIWGCVGRWFSGSWYDQGAIDYIKTVKTHYANEDWLKAGFSG